MGIVGTYRVTSSGSVIGEYQNMITANGLIAINQYLAGISPHWAGSLGIGSLYKYATSSVSSALDYEFQRYPITLRSYRVVSAGVNQQALKVSIPAETIFSAYEIGIFPMTVEPASYYDHLQITDFSERTSGSSSWLISGVPATSVSGSHARIGNYSISLSGGQTTTAAIYANTSNHNSGDNISLLFQTASAFTSTASIYVSLSDSSASGSVWTASGQIPVQVINSFSSSSLIFQAKPDSFNDEVTSASISLVCNGKLYLDHMKIYFSGQHPVDNTLVSRKGNSTALFTKAYGQPMEIEYYIRVT